MKPEYIQRFSDPLADYFKSQGCTITTVGRRQMVDSRGFAVIAFNEIATDQFFTRRAKPMTTNADEAIKMVETSTNKMLAALDRLVSAEQGMSEQTKKISGSIRASEEKLAQGLSRIEKAANFDRLERYVGLLERAATAMRLLSELEASGKLEKIAGAIR